MIVLNYICPSAPPNWVLRWGVAPTVAVLAAIARDDAELPEPLHTLSCPKGTVTVLAEAAVAYDHRKLDRTERLLALRYLMLQEMARLGVSRERITLSAIERYATAERGVLDWAEIIALYRSAGLSPGFAQLPVRKQSIRALSNPRDDGPRLYVSPSCGRLSELRDSDLEAAAKNNDAVRALCHALEI